jgi:hypothetical protein
MLAPTPFKTADELGIREADRLGLIEVLSGLEDGMLNQANFFMVSWGECICGWAHKLCEGAFLGFHSRSVGYSASLWRLFDGYPRHPVPGPSEVRVVLRNYLLTGEVNWIDLPKMLALSLFLPNSGANEEISDSLG